MPHNYWFSDDNYELYPSTAFIFQLAAEMLAGSKAGQENAMTLIKELWNSKYSVVILAFVGDAFSDLIDFNQQLAFGSHGSCRRWPCACYLTTC